MNKVKVLQNTAIVTINGDTREFPIEWRDGMPWLNGEAAWVGVKLGRTGQKVWLSKARICRNARYKASGLSGTPEYVLDAYSPLNSINHEGVFVQIMAWWDKVPDGAKSQR